MNEEKEELIEQESQVENRVPETPKEIINEEPPVVEKLEEVNDELPDLESLGEAAKVEAPVIENQQEEQVTEQIPDKPKKVVKETPNQKAPIKAPKDMDLKKIMLIVGIIVGIISLFMGINVLNKHHSFHRYGYITTYFGEGSNYYTYSYESTAYTADNVAILGDIVQRAAGYLLIVLGLSDISFFGWKFASTKK